MHLILLICSLASFQMSSSTSVSFSNQTIPQPPVPATLTPVVWARVCSSLLVPAMTINTWQASRWEIVKCEVDKGQFMFTRLTLKQERVELKTVWVCGWVYLTCSHMDKRNYWLTIHLRGRNGVKTPTDRWECNLLLGVTMVTVISKHL